MRMLIRVLICLISASAIPAYQVDYTGHKLISIIPKNEEQIQFLRALRDNSSIDLWNDFIGVHRSSLLHLEPSSISSIERKLFEKGISFSTSIENLQDAIDEEKKSIASGERIYAIRRIKLQLNNYHRLEQIEQLLVLVQFTFPKLATIIEIGRSVLDRPINALKISTGQAKKATILEFGIHAREWLSPSTAFYIIHNIISEFERDDEIRSLLKAYDIYIIPVLNPDGYEHSHTTGRFWRKNLKKNTNSKCLGVDLNRNFDIHWGGIGSNRNDPCNETYPGTGAFSEPETRAVRDLVMKLKPSLKAYFAIHTFGQLWMFPHGYKTDKPPHYEELMAASKIATDAIKAKHGTTYKYGTVPDTINYLAAGGSDDWVYEVCGIKHTYTIELRDAGHKGFVLPADEILPTAEEVWDGLKAILFHIHKTDKE